MFLKTLKKRMAGAPIGPLIIMIFGLIVFFIAIVLFVSFAMKGLGILGKIGEKYGWVAAILKGIMGFAQWLGA